MEPISPIQALFDGMAANWKRKRAQTQMTLGKLITQLETLPPERTVAGIGHAASYRGYYSDLSFSPEDEPRTVADLLKECRASMGKVFQGYKGGDFVMGELTPVWIANYGDCGPRLMALDVEAEPIRAITAEEER